MSILSRTKRPTANGGSTSGGLLGVAEDGDEHRPGIGPHESAPTRSDTADEHPAETSTCEQDVVKGHDTENFSEPGSADADATHPEEKTRRKRPTVRGALSYGVLPILTLVLAVAAGYLKWHDASIRQLQTARTESVQAATDGTIKMLSYRPDTVDNDLGSARERMTGTFRDSYTQLTHDVVIPGSKQKQISAVATIPAAASVSASDNHAVVLLFVNQSIIVGNDAPSSTASSVKVILDKVNGRWLISDFTPI
jgi:Mce-associated membrane protein